VGSGTPQIDRALLDDLCAESGFHYDGEESLDILVGIVNHVLAMDEAMQHKWRSAPPHYGAPAPAAAPAAPGWLVDAVTEAIRLSVWEDSVSDWSPEARAAIAAVAEWLERKGCHIQAQMLWEEIQK
jgi:Asp-tRNA(Asn)/Glu-tRNA(Gln) amidotransferase A subunit family amidase